MEYHRGYTIHRQGLTTKGVFLCFGYIYPFQTRKGVKPKMRKPGVKIRLRGQKYYVYVNYKGLQKAKCIGTDYHLAELAKAKIETELILGTFKIEQKEEKEKVVLKEYGEKWLNGYAKTHIQESTMMEYREVMKNHIYPAFGHLQLNQIKRSEVRDFITRKFQDGLAVSTVKNILAPFRGILNYAIEDELIESNPAMNQGRVLKNQKKRTKSKIQVWNEDEILVFLNTVKTVCPNLWIFLYTVLFTGCRMGEMRVLKRQDFHLTERYLEMSRAISRGKIKATKTYKVRRIDLHPELVDILRGYFGEKDIQSMETGKKYEWAFCDVKGQIWGEWYIRNHFYDCIRESGVSKIRFHDLRHTFASLLLSKGINPPYVAEQLGDTLEMVYEVYGHWIPTKIGREVDRLIVPKSESKRDRDVTSPVTPAIANSTNFSNANDLSSQI